VRNISKINEGACFTPHHLSSPYGGTEYGEFSASNILYYADIFDLYTDYLITSFSYTTATGLSGLVDNAISHDPVTRFLSQQDFTSKELGKVIKKTVREIETGEMK
jgi:hypothetical protein